MLLVSAQEYKILGYRDREINEIIKYEAWRDRVVPRLPEISQRVFALRDKHYLGCGFQWSIERELGKVIFSIMNHDDAPLDPGREAVAQRIAIRAIVWHLFKNVHSAEQSTTKIRDWL